MTREDRLATITAQTSAVRAMIDHAALGTTKSFHESLYLNVRDGVLNVIGTYEGAAAVSYCTFTDEYFDSIELATSEYDYIEAVIRVGEFLHYLGLVSDGGTVEMSFLGNSQRADEMEIEGALNTTFFIQNSDSVYERFHTGAGDHFNEDDQLVTKSGEVLGTEIQTVSATFQKITEVIDSDDGLDRYPLTVKDGDLYLDTRNDQNSRNDVWGRLSDATVEGEDFSNSYRRGFKPLFDTLQGQVTVSSEQDKPLCAVSYLKGGSATVRHLITPLPPRK